jgi:hypothetical protein
MWILRKFAERNDTCIPLADLFITCLRQIRGGDRSEINIYMASAMTDIFETNR